MSRRVEHAEQAGEVRAKVLACALVLYQQRAFPEQANVVVLARDALDWLLKAGHQPPLDAEHIEEFVP